MSRYLDITKKRPHQEGIYELKCHNLIGEYFSKGYWNGEVFLNKFNMITPLKFVIGWRRCKEPTDTPKLSNNIRYRKRVFKGTRN